MSVNHKDGGEAADQRPQGTVDRMGEVVWHIT